MTDHFLDIERGLSQLLELVHDDLPRKDEDLVRQFIEVGEYGLALETTAFSLIDNNKPINPAIRDQICELGAKMNMKADVFEEIRQRARKSREGDSS